MEKILLPAGGAMVLVPWQRLWYPCLQAPNNVVYLIKLIQAKLVALRGLSPIFILVWFISCKIWLKGGAANSVKDTERVMGGLENSLMQTSLLTSTSSLSYANKMREGRLKIASHCKSSD